MDVMSRVPLTDGTELSVVTGVGRRQVGPSGGEVELSVEV
jgi:hypothetical protein